MKNLMLFYFVAVVNLFVWAETYHTVTTNGYTWTYVIENGRAKIAKSTPNTYTGGSIYYYTYECAISPKPQGTLSIPSELGGYPVCCLGPSAFSECDELTSIEIPSSICEIANKNMYESVGNSVYSYGGQIPFYGCSNLTDVVDHSWVVCSNGVRSCFLAENLTNIVIASDSVTVINTNAFAGCIRIENLVIPDGIQSVEPYAFSNCCSLLDIEVPRSVRSIGYRAFFGCSSLTNMVLPFIGGSRDPEYIARHLGYIFETEPYDGGVYVSFIPGVFNGHYYIPQTLRTISVTDATTIWGRVNPYSSTWYYSSFYNCDFLTKVTLSEHVKSIGAYAFCGCSGLSDIAIPSSVTNIGNAAFSGCRGLSSIVMPGGVTTIGASAFYNCSGMMDVTFLGNAPATSGSSFAGVNESCVAHVYYGSTGWDVDIPGTWKGLRIEYITSTVEFNASSGILEENNRAVYAGTVIGELPVPTRKNYRFIGWFTSEDGGTEVDSSFIVNEDMTLYAHWLPAVANPVIEPSSETLFSNVSQSVMISCETVDAAILYSTDGSDPAVNGIEYKGPFEVYESCTVRAIARKNGLVDSDEASVTLTRAEGLSEAANLYGYLMETDGSYPWTVVTDVSHDGVSCVRSGAIGNGGTTHLTASVRKAGTVSFWWKAACEDADVEDDETYYYDYGVFLVDDVEKAWIAGHDTGWRKVVVDVPSGGKHVLKWEYRKDGATSYAPDCVWLDQVQWIPADGGGYTLTTPEPVPYAWLSGYGLGLDSDFETAAKCANGKRGGDGRALQVWQDYVAGTDPTNVASVFRAGIELVDDVPYITWSPNLNTNGIERIYTIWGKTNLTDGADWECPTNAAHRFFKVSVEMP